MTFAYSCLFVGTWMCGFVGLAMFLPLLAWTIVQSIILSKPDTVLIAISGVVFLIAVFGVWTRLWPTIKHQIRAGVFPASLFTDVFPLNEEELVKHCMNNFQNGFVNIVSHGWSFYLKKKPPGTSNVWTTRFKGRVDMDSYIPIVWKSGTDLKTLKKDLSSIGRTLLDTPSMEWLSLGSWIVSCSHGHPGLKSPSLSPLHWVNTARVLDCETGKITSDDETTLFAKFHSTASHKSKYVILTVELKKTAIIEDKIIQRRAFLIENATDLDRWKQGALVRLMFVSRHRRSLGIVWNPPERTPIKTTSRYHMHPHICSRIAFWQHSDLNSALPIWCCFGENLDAYDGFAKASEALSGINPDFYPFQTVWPHVFCVYNLELFCPLPASTLGNTDWLFKLIKQLEEWHWKNGGRTELRLSADNSVLFLDLSTRSVSSMSNYFELLYANAIKSAAQHSGKFVTESINPLKEVTVSAVMRPLSAVNVNV